MDCVPLPVDDVPKPHRLVVNIHTVMKIDVEYYDASNPVF